MGALAIAAMHFWWKTMRAREKADKLAFIACQKENMQLLDGTVALKRFGYEKSKAGGRYLLRYFGFEFSSNGTDRRQGLLALYGEQQHYMYMDLPESPTISVENPTQTEENL